MNNLAAAAETWQMLSGILQASRMIPEVQRAAHGSLPLTVISGFLGAGKTTLLNRLLTQPHGRRIAVLVNDFGRINIDAALIRSQTENMISLTNGCACCTVAGDLTKALIELAQRIDAPDAIVLEASGLADPRGIAQVALANPALRLDGVLAVVDAETIAKHAADPATSPTFLAQVSAADLIVLNKLDLAGEVGLRTAREWLNTHAPAKPVIDAINAQVPVDLVLGINSAQVLTSELEVASNHAAAFRSWSASNDDLLDTGRIREMLAGLPAGVLRAKGILRLSDAPAHRTVYQRVGPRSSFVQGDRDGNTPRSSLVVIGHRDLIVAQDLSRRFDACRA